MSKSTPIAYFLYDGECPFCAQYAQFQAIREAVPGLVLVSMRNKEAMSKVPLKGVTDLSQGMVFIDSNGNVTQGKEALVELSSKLETNTTWHKALRLGANPCVAKAIYPVVFTARKIALFIKGVPSKIDH